MPETSPAPSATPPAETGPLRGRRALLEKHPWVVFVLPMVVYMVVGAMEPRQSEPRVIMPSVTEPSESRKSKERAEVKEAGAGDAEPGNADAQGATPRATDKAGKPFTMPPSRHQFYPLFYTVKIALTLLAVWFVLPGYRAFPLRFSPLAVLVGAAGIVVWIGLRELHLEQKWLEPLGLKSLLELGQRPGFNPFRAMADQPAWQLWGFLAVRLVGLVIVVALIEELFLRGFLMRFVMDVDWPQIPVGRVNWAAVAACVAYAVLSHPAELFAAAAWFLLITLLAVKTKNIWDCVVAHAVTNSLLGIWVLVRGDWKYW